MRPVLPDDIHIASPRGTEVRSEAERPERPEVNGEPGQDSRCRENCDSNRARHIIAELAAEPQPRGTVPRRSQGAEKIPHAPQTEMAAAVAPAQVTVSTISPFLALGGLNRSAPGPS